MMTRSNSNARRSEAEVQGKIASGIVLALRQIIQDKFERSKLPEDDLRNGNRQIVQCVEHHSNVPSPIP